MNPPSLFLSCDWGTSTFRLRLVRLPDCRIELELREPVGVRSVHAALPADSSDHSVELRERTFAEFLAAQVRELCGRAGLPAVNVPIVISGMASSSVGWRELPYASVPFALNGSTIGTAQIDLKRLVGLESRVHLISGLRTATDVLRGEETEIVGLFRCNEWERQAASSVLILPGTHSKHIVIRDRTIVDFQTYMTGELFEVLSSHSILRTSLQPPAKPAPSLDASEQQAFLEGLNQARVSGLAAGLFRTRTRQVLDRNEPSLNRRFLSGLLIGDEIQNLARTHPNDPILLAASRNFYPLYQAALEHLGFAPRLEIVPPASVELAAVFGQAALLLREFE